MKLASKPLALLSFLSLVFPFFSVSFSEVTTPVKIRVIKSKGKEALIRVSNLFPGELPPGIYILSPGNNADVSTTEEKRDHSISANLESGFYNTSTTISKIETKVDVKSMNLNLTYGWNKKAYEFGPFLSYNFQTVGSSDNKSLSTGMFFDWNFVKNTEDKTWVPGLRVLAGIGQIDNSGIKSGYSSNILQIGLVAKYFYLQANQAITAEIAYRSENAKPENMEIKTSGTLTRIGIINYF